MANIILHIGDGKCGSTSIQNSLYESRESLKEQGILFETLTPNSGHSVLPLLVGHSSRAASSRRIELANKTISLLQDSLSKFDWVVISAENLINLPLESINSLMGLLGCTVNDAHAIAYVREPAAMYLSSVQQILKGSHLFPAPETYHRRVDKKLATWRKLVGADRLTVRTFERSSLVQGDVVADFESWLGTVTGRPCALQQQVANASMTAEQTRALQSYRAAVYPDIPGMLMARSTLVGQFFNGLNAVRPVGNPIALSDLARDVVRSQNSDVALQLGKLFPDVRFPAPKSAASSQPPETFPWHGNTDVSCILDRCDFELANLLCELLPDMQEAAPTQPSRIREILHVLAEGQEPVFAQYEAVYADYLHLLQGCVRKEKRVTFTSVG